MPSFRYTAVDESGRAVSETCAAQDRQAALEQLSRKGLRDVVLVEVEQGRQPQKLSKPFELGEDDYTAVAENLAEIAAAQQPLAGGLRALAEETTSRRLKRGLIQVADQLEAGAPLDEVLTAKLPGFPPHLAGLVRAGLQAGCLDRVLQQSLTYSMRSAALRRRVKLYAAYPLILAVLVGALVVWVLFYIIPQFQKIFHEFGTATPWLTGALFAVCDLVRDHSLLFAIGAAAVVFGGAGLLWTFCGRAGIRRFVCRIPLFGNMLRSAALMEYCHLLAVLLESRMPLPEALRYAAGGVHDADLAEASLRLADEVAGGSPYVWTLGTYPQFPAVFRQFVKWGERNQAYPDALHAIGDVCEGRAKVLALLFVWMLEPLVIISVGVGAAVVVLALFVPLITLLNQLS